MTTRKFNVFEYTGRVAGPDPVGLHREDMFETPNGFAFVIAASSGEGEEDAGRTATALERIRYYLENETDDRVEVVARNALMYTNGYLFQTYQKEAGGELPPLSCLCVIFRDGKVHYAWVGDICLYVFTGKRMVPLSWPMAGSKTPDAVMRFMGEQPVISPQFPDEPLLPVNEDLLLAGSGKSCELFCLKQTRKILQDSMPSQTKVARMVRLVEGQDQRQAMALQMLRFYNVENRQRSFVEGREHAAHRPGLLAENEGMQKKGSKKQAAEKKPAPDKEVLKKVRYIAYLAGLLLVGYMFYDLFLYNPKPPSDIPLPSETAQVEVESPEDTLSMAMDASRALPEDIPYTVGGGDTWSRIYSQFGVCSWFIINHPPNSGRFGPDGTLITNTRLQIPVRYSGDPELNPYYYTEFTTEVVGSSCENAGQELRDNFLEMVQTQ
ncbi:MAG: hypothetical protein ACLFN2_08625 [Bacteroidales bacterium]